MTIGYWCWLRRFVGGAVHYSLFPQVNGYPNTNNGIGVIIHSTATEIEVQACIGDSEPDVVASFKVEKTEHGLQLVLDTSGVTAGKIVCESGDRVFFGKIVVWTTDQQPGPAQSWPR